MEILDRIDKERKAQKKSQIELCEFLGISKNAYTNWKSGHMQSYKKYLPQIAEFLNVSVDYLIGNTKEKSQPVSELSSEEQEIIEKFNKLNPRQRDSLKILLDSFQENQ